MKGAPLAAVVACAGALLAAPAEPAEAQAAPVPRIDSLVLDGRLEEWGAAELPSLGVSPSGRFLVFGVRLPEPVLVQAEGELTVRFDPLDADRRVRWNYADRAGTQGSDTLRPSDVGLRVHPTVRSAEFELGFEVERLAGRLGVDPGETVGVRLANGETTLFEGTFAWPPLPSAGRRAGADRIAPASAEALRVVAWNLERNALFDAERSPAIGRILRLLDADLLVLTEVYDSTAPAVAATLDALLPTPDAAGWKARKAGDVVLAVRDSLGPAVDLGFEWGRAVAANWHAPGDRRILVVGAHLPCCTGGSPPADRRRDLMVEQIAATVHHWSVIDPPGGGDPALRLVTGDLNLVGDARTLDPLTNPPEGAEGGAFVPVDLGHLDGEETYTWSFVDGAFAPSRLDYLLVGEESRERVERAFVFDDADVADPAAAGIRAGDSTLASDHLPLIVDLVVPRGEGS